MLHALYPLPGYFKLRLCRELEIVVGIFPYRPAKRCHSYVCILESSRIVAHTTGHESATHFGSVSFSSYTTQTNIFGNFLHHKSQGQFVFKQYSVIYFVTLYC